VKFADDFEKSAKDFGKSPNDFGNARAVRLRRPGSTVRRVFTMPLNVHPHLRKTRREVLRSQCWRASSAHRIQRGGWGVTDANGHVAARASCSNTPCPIHAVKGVIAVLTQSDIVACGAAGGAARAAGHFSQAPKSRRTAKRSGIATGGFCAADQTNRLRSESIIGYRKETAHVSCLVRFVADSLRISRLPPSETAATHVNSR
jgi:hypothetical protein